MGNFILSQEDVFAVNESNNFKVFNEKNIGQIPQIQGLSKEQQFEMFVVARVLPFRVNNHVINKLIDWDKVPNDPIFQLTFPQRSMLDEASFDRIASILKKKNSNELLLEQEIKEIRSKLNPQPAGQLLHNIPILNGKPLKGLQHKYKETVLFFPSQGQTCHSYCTFCFRWAQFIGDKSLKFESNEIQDLVAYIKHHQDVTDILITGGDPMVANARHLALYLEPFITDPGLKHITSIRIGTKSLTYWPQRFVNAPDADDLLRLLEKLVNHGKHVSIMAHYNHWRELEPDISRTAIKRLQNAGTIIRSQGPILKHINDSSNIWIKMWNEQVKLGIIPYYMFVERDTGARNYFELPLHEVYSIYSSAITAVSGLARTARGPSMSAGPGKIEIQGIADLNEEKVFILKFLQSRNSDWGYKPFFAKYDEHATWFDQLRPAFGKDKFFFSDEYEYFTKTKDISI